MSKNRVHIVLVSDQILPIVLPAMDYNLKPDKIILCESEEMARLGVGRRLAGFFKANKIRNEIFKLGDVDDFTKLHQKLGELASRFGSHASDVIVNLCGSSAYAPVVMQNVFAAKNMTCIYVQPRQNQMIAMSGGKIQHYQLQDKLKLNDYFRIHGCRILSKREKNLKLMSGSHALCRELLSDFGRYSPHISYLERLAAGAENHFSLRARVKLTQDNTPVFELFQRHGFISSFDKGVVKFASEEDRAFCKGIWLEDYLHQSLKNISRDVGLQDFATCVEFVASSDIRYACSAAFLFKNRLYTIMTNAPVYHAYAQEEVFPIKAVNDFDQKSLTPIALCLHELNDREHTRVNLQGFHLIQSSAMEELEQRLLSLLH